MAEEQQAQSPSIWRSVLVGVISGVITSLILGLIVEYRRNDGDEEYERETEWVDE